jgi:hypothetical protein
MMLRYGKTSGSNELTRRGNASVETLRTNSADDFRDRSIRRTNKNVPIAAKNDMPRVYHNEPAILNALGDELEALLPES